MKKHMESALCIQNLCKQYKNGTVALNDVSMNVNVGDFFALLGPNGAGKSTLINTIAFLSKQTAGCINVYGFDQERQKNKVKSLIGLVPQEFNFNILENPFEIVVNQARFYGIRKSVAKKRAEALLKELDLWGKRSVMAMSLSGGMKRRLMIARALVHQPTLLLLDEPTAGVDIEIRKSMWNFLREKNLEGMTIILTTHYLEEAETLCNKVAIINKGKILVCDEMQKLLINHQDKKLIIDLQMPLPISPEIEGCRFNFISDLVYEVEILQGYELGALLAQFDRHKINIKAVRNLNNRLETLFLEHVTKGKEYGYATDV